MKKTRFTHWFVFWFSIMMNSQKYRFKLRNKKNVFFRKRWKFCSYMTIMITQSIWFLKKNFLWFIIQYVVKKIENFASIYRRQFNKWSYMTFHYERRRIDFFRIQIKRKISIVCKLQKFQCDYFKKQNFIVIHWWNVKSFDWNKIFHKIKFKKCLL